MNILGVDPGADGAFAVITPERGIYVFRFKNQTNQKIFEALAMQSIAKTHTFFERVGAMPGQGVTSMFSFGSNVGFLKGVLTALWMPFEEVSPQTWQKSLGLGKASPNKSERKRKHQALAQQLFPHMGVTLSECDAILTAEYGWRQMYRK